MPKEVSLRKLTEISNILRDLQDFACEAKECKDCKMYIPCTLLRNMDSEVEMLYNLVKFDKLK